MEATGEETKTGTDVKPSEEGKETKPPKPQPSTSQPKQENTSAKPPPIKKPTASDEAKIDESNDVLIRQL